MKTFVLTITMALVFISCNFSKTNELTNNKQAEYDACWKKIENKKYDIVFIGDSITCFGNFENEIDGCVNLGVCGDTIRGLIYRKEMIKAVNPKIVFLMIGINSLYANAYGGGDELINNCINEYETLLKSIISEGMTIYIETVLPTDYWHPAHDIIDNFNAKLIALAQKYKIEVIDLNPLYKENGVLRPSDTYDGLHLKKTAYQPWYDKVKTIINE